MKKLNKRQKLIFLITMITVLVIVGVAIGINAIRMNIANSNYESSNGNSSNGNLLPEYIKAGITLGGVTGTLKDLDTSDATATPEDILEGKTAYVNGVKITGTKVVNVEPVVGGYVEYTPDDAEDYILRENVSGAHWDDNRDQTILQEKELKWKIWNINDDGAIELISATPTTTYFYLSGGVGYNNAVDVINDICAKLYSNETLGATARNVKIEDLQDEFNTQGIDVMNSYVSDNGTKIGSTYEQKGGITGIAGSSARSFPILYRGENGSVIDSETVKTDGYDVSEGRGIISDASKGTSYTMSSTWKATQTYYSMTVNNIQSYFDNKDKYNLMFGENKDFSFWIASRYANAYSNHVRFGVRGIVDEVLSGSDMWLSTGWDRNYNNYLRPIVTIPANIKFTGGNGSEENPFKISI